MFTSNVRSNQFPLNRGVMGAMIGAALLGAARDSASAQCTELKKFWPTTSSSSQNLGRAMAVDGNVMIVGAPGDDTKATDAGSAYVFRFDAASESWNEEAQLFASDAAVYDKFGTSVDIDGDLAIVGAPEQDAPKGNNSGAAYIFRRSGSVWSQESKLFASGGLNEDQFGISVSLDGSAAVVGAWYSDLLGSDSGAAFVFRYKGAVLKWLEEQQLMPPDGAVYDNAGVSVELVGNLAFVSATGDDAAPLYDLGTVSTYRFNGSVWSFEHTLAPASGQSYGYFGTSLSSDGTILVVGAPSVDIDHGTSIDYDVGAVYVFRWNGSQWLEEATLSNPVPAAYEYFGQSVSALGDVIAVGTQYIDLGRYDCGAAFLFRRLKGSWYADGPLGLSDRQDGDHLGRSVALRSGYLCVGAPSDDSPPNYDAGSIALYRTAEFQFDVDNHHPAPGAPFTMKAFCGDPGELALIIVSDVNGIPLFLPVILYVFSSDHTLTLPVTAPNPAYGLNVGLKAYKIGVAGNIVGSDVEHVDL